MLLTKIIFVLIFTAMPLSLAFKAYVDWTKDGEVVAIVPMAFNIAIAITVAVLIIKS